MGERDFQTKRKDAMGRRAPRYLRLQALGEKKMQEIDTLLHTKSVPFVARVLQNEWKVLVDVKLPTLTRQLTRYRDYELHKNLVVARRELKRLEHKTEKVQERREELDERVILKRIQTRINPIIEMMELYTIQKMRLNKLKEREDPLPAGTLLEQMSKEIMNANSILDRMGRLMIDVGIAKRFLDLGDMGDQNPDTASGLLPNVQIAGALRIATLAAMKQMQDLARQQQEDQDVFPGESITVSAD